MPAPSIHHSHKRLLKDYVDSDGANNDSVNNNSTHNNSVHSKNNADNKQTRTALEVSAIASNTLTPQHCIGSVRESLLQARLGLLEYSVDRLQAAQLEQAQAVSQHTHKARAKRLQQQMRYLDQLRAAAKHKPLTGIPGQQDHHPDDGIFEACEQALDNALCVLERLPRASYMVDLNELVWQVLADLATKQYLETGITITLPIILGNPQILAWLITELVASSVLECLELLTRCQPTLPSLLIVDCLDTPNYWRLNISVSKAACTTPEHAGAVHSPPSLTPPSLTYVKQATALLEGDVWVEVVNPHETTLSLTLPKRVVLA